MEEPIPAFHPIKYREKDVWYPSNVASILLIHINHIVEDIHILFKIKKGLNDKYENALLLKYIIIETKNLLEKIDNLKTIIFKTPIKDTSNKNLFRYLTLNEMEKAKELFKSYDDNKKEIEDEINKIRNKIGAHRDIDNWNFIIELYDKLEISEDRLYKLFDTIDEILPFIKDLNIYDWFREPKPGLKSFFGTRIID